MVRFTWCLVVTAAVAVGGCGKNEDGKRDRAQAMADRLASEGYLRWAMKPSNQGLCPEGPAVLAEYVGQQPDFNDPWGRPFVIRCGDDAPAGVKGIGVLSLGPDGKPDTADDLRSWE